MSAEPTPDVDRGEDDAGEAKPRIEVTTGPDTWRRILAFVQEGRLPDTYVTAGQLVHIERVSGRTVQDRTDKDSPLPVAASVSNPDLFATQLVEHAYVYKVDGRHGREFETFPPDQVTKKVLAGRHWPGVPTLLGIIGAPVLRPDGTLLQDNGYDARTGLYLEKKVDIGEVPDKPTPEQVTAARAFIVDELLGDFPWKSKADKANYIGVLVTQILRPYLRCLVPLVVITATTPSSGKTILTAASGMLYGQKFLTWPERDEELHKTISAVLAEPAGVVIFDNLREGTTIESPVLAALLTTETFSVRKFGRNDKTLSYINDRIWITTGNNLQLGGDMGSRAILVSLDPNMEKPEERTGFTVPNLPQAIVERPFQARVLWHLLVLVADWVNAGSPKKRGPTLRQFTPWLEAIGGFLDHHAVPGFFENRDETREINEGDAAWHGFLATWWELYEGKRFRPAELRKTADPAPGYGGDPADDGRWRGDFLKMANGRVPTATWLGRMLVGRTGRFHGPYVLRSAVDGHAKARYYWVERTDRDASPANDTEFSTATPAYPRNEPLTWENP